MEITQVKVHLRSAAHSKLKAFVTITFDDMFVIRDLKVIEGKKGLFVAMPSVKRKESCPSCGKKNPVRVKFCSECGTRLPDKMQQISEEERREEHRDIAHPITPQAREYIQKRIMGTYNEVREKADRGEYVNSEEHDKDVLDDLDEKEYDHREWNKPVASDDVVTPSISFDDHHLAVDRDEQDDPEEDQEN
ncbi:septation protein SpoVG family protein [Chlamydiota bacterium]